MFSLRFFKEYEVWTKALLVIEDFNLLLSQVMAKNYEYYEVRHSVD